MHNQNPYNRQSCRLFKSKTLTTTCLPLCFGLLNNPIRFVGSIKNNLINQLLLYTCGQVTHCLLSSYTVLHSKPVSSSSTFQQRHYRSRQLVLSGQLCPFISLAGTAVIKRNEETGSNSEAKNHSSVSFTSFCSFPLPVCLCYFLALHPSLLPLAIYTHLSLTMLPLLFSPETEEQRHLYKV